MTAGTIQLGSPTQDPWITLQLAAAALNSTEYVKGFSSFQWRYGKNHSITDEEVRTFPSLPEQPGDDYADWFDNAKTLKRLPGRHELCVSCQNFRTVLLGSQFEHFILCNL